MKIKSVINSLFGVEKGKAKKEYQVYLDGSKIKFRNVKVYTGVFDLIDEIILSEIETIAIYSEYDRGNTEANVYVKIASREQMISIDNYMEGFEKFVEELFKVFSIDKSFNKFYDRAEKCQCIYYANK